jgi:hypothetical protein
VIFIPGFGGSFVKDAGELTLDETDDETRTNIDDWYVNRGLTPDRLALEPLGQAYYDIVQSLDNVGYTLYDDTLTDAANISAGANLFIAAWDWRLPVAGVNDGTVDGILNGITDLFSNNVFESGVDYLGYWLQKAKDITGSEKVDIITHSTGGLVARSYIQSDAYGATLSDGLVLPTVEDLVLVGVPNEGTSEVFNFLQDDWNGKPASLALSRLVNKSYELVTTGNHETIYGSDGNFVWDATQGQLNFVKDVNAPNDDTDNIIITNVTKEQFAANYIRTLNDLFATFEFFDDGSGTYQALTDEATISTLLGGSNDVHGVKPNHFLLDINAIDLQDAQKVNDFVNATVTTQIIYSSQVETKDQILKRVGPASITEGGYFTDAVQSFTDILGESPATDQVWYQDIASSATNGDGTVSTISTLANFAQIYGAADNITGSLIINQILANDAGEIVDHGGLVVNSYAQQQILAAIGVTNIDDEDISTNQVFSSLQSVFKAFDLGILSTDDLADINLDGVIQSQLNQIVAKWDELVSGLTDSSFLTTNIPIIDRSLDSLLGEVLGGSNGSLASILSIGNDASNYLSNEAVPTLFGLFGHLGETITDKLDGLTSTLDDYTSFGPISIDGGLDFGDQAIYIDVNLDVLLNPDFDFDLENSAIGQLIADSLGDLQIDANFAADLTIKAELTGTLRLGLIISDLIDNDDSTVIDFSDLFLEMVDPLDPLTVALDVSLADLDLGISIDGLGSLGIVDGSANISVSVNLSLDDSSGNNDGKLTLAEIQTISSENSITDLFDFEVGSSVDITLPIAGQISNDLLDFDGVFTVTVPEYDIFSGDELQLDLTFEGTLTIDDFFHLDGEFAFSKTQGDLVLSNGTEITDASYRVISGANINVFAGNAPNADPTAEGAVGLSLEDINFSLLLFTDSTTGFNYTALNSSGGSASFIGIPGLDLAFNDFSLQLNQTSNTSNPNLVLDFNTEGSQRGIPITPITGPEIDLDGDRGSLLTIAGQVEINAYGYLMASAIFSMERRRINVDLNGDEIPDLEDANLISFELSEVNAFAGFGDADTNDDGVFDQTDLDAITADPSQLDGIGFALNNGQLGLAVITADQQNNPGVSSSYLALS